MSQAIPTSWEPSIRAFEALDQQSPPPEKPVLFVGSSSIRLWNLKKYFPGLPAINRGFGGSELSDSLHYFDRIVLPYRPRLVLLYAGDNDIALGTSADTVIANYQAFAAKVRSQLPRTHFAFLSIKPSVARHALWPEITRANNAIHRHTESDSSLHYLDIATPMLGDNRQPEPGFFMMDGVHLNRTGYQLWTNIAAPWITSH